MQKQKGWLQWILYKIYFFSNHLVQNEKGWLQWTHCEIYLFSIHYVKKRKQVCFWWTHLQVVIPCLNSGNDARCIRLQNGDLDVCGGDDRCILVAVNVEIDSGVAHSCWSATVCSRHRQLVTSDRCKITSTEEKI